MRVMCTGRVDPSFILRGFSKGADGVFVGGCHLNECNYTTHGNFYALRITHLCKKLLELMGVNPERLRIEFISGGEGTRFAEIVNSFSETIRGLGPLGAEEGLDEEGLSFKFEAAMKLVPYLKLMERERFRVQYATAAEYADYFRSDEFNRLFRATLGEKLAVSQTIALLQRGPLSTAKIAEHLGLTPSDVSRHLNASSRQGLVRYDAGQKCYALT